MLIDNDRPGVRRGGTERLDDEGDGPARILPATEAWFERPWRELR